MTGVNSLRLMYVTYADSIIDMVVKNIPHLLKTIGNDSTPYEQHYRWGGKWEAVLRNVSFSKVTHASNNRCYQIKGTNKDIGRALFT